MYIYIYSLRFASSLLLWVSSLNIWLRVDMQIYKFVWACIYVFVHVYTSAEAWWAASVSGIGVESGIRETSSNFTPNVFGKDTNPSLLRPSSYGISRLDFLTVDNYQSIRRKTLNSRPMRMKWYTWLSFQRRHGISQIIKKKKNYDRLRLRGTLGFQWADTYHLSKCDRSKKKQ